MTLRTLVRALLLLMPMLAWAQVPVSSAQVGQPDGWNRELALNTPQDLNPDPRILEINLEAVVKEMEIVRGKKTPVWSYNGYLPGPLLKLNVGDRLIVHFKNSLPMATSIHWHGLRVPNNMDGVPGFTQPMIEPGQSFTYDFVVPDAGTFWYHPHVESAAQVGYGLYGPLIVNDPNEPKIPGDELVLVFSDISIDDDGSLLVPKEGGRFGDLFGREGSTVLVNGKVLPTLTVRQGKQQRWRVLNMSRTRYFTLRYKRSPLVLVGSDGGLMEKSRTVDEIKLVPAERYDFVFTPPDAPNSEGIFKWYPTDRGYGSTYNRIAEDIMKIRTVNQPRVTPEPVPEKLRTITAIDTKGAKEREMNLTIGYDKDENVAMGINGVHYKDAAPLMVKVGATEVWTIRNDTDFNHPFHLHGFFFQEVAPQNGVLQWKDTIDVPQHTQKKIVVKFDDRPGMWMFHCHILDHADVGMMGHLHLMP